MTADTTVRIRSTWHNGAIGRVMGYDASDGTYQVCIVVSGHRAAFWYQATELEAI